MKKTAKIKIKAKAVAKTPAQAIAPKKVVAVKAKKIPATPAAPVKTPVEAPAKTLKLSKEIGAKYKRLLVELRDHLIDGVSFLANDNLKRTARDASGELSGYSTHPADAGTDNFDREFALSLVSNEQEALYEIEESLKRLEDGTYGVCEMCEKLIRKERLEAVPFARFCIQCQSGVEKDRRHPQQTTAVFSETADEEGDGDEPEEKN
ncbi:MAG: TraR/DksA C4-type zinc finger protein [Verrucomicrobiota bacterium]|jgi:RNA polymerase-binding transcription factor DksA